MVFVNQGSVLLVKGGGQAIYLEFVVCGELMPVANPDPSINLETHDFKKMRLLCMCQFITKQQVCMVVSQKNQLILHFVEVPMNVSIHMATVKRKTLSCIVP